MINKSNFTKIPNEILELQKKVAENSAAIEKLMVFMTVVTLLIISLLVIMFASFFS